MGMAARLPPVVHHSAYSHVRVPAGHRFPSSKFERVAARVRADGLAGPDGFATPAPAPASWLALAHDPDYVAAVLAAEVPAQRARRIGFPMTPAAAERAAAAVGGTVLAARLALARGLACNTAGGSHHADHDGGAGFCVFNDVAVAARLLLAEGAIRSALVIDLDVHQGDGTARIFESDDRVFTYSAHCEKNWPHRKARSDWDDALPVGLGDDDYLARVARALPLLLARRPDLVFYVAGVDPHTDDQLGLLALTDDGLARREAMVAQACMEAGAPMVGVLGGGYDADVDRLAARHVLLHQACATALSGADARRAGRDIGSPHQRRAAARVTR